MHSSDSERSVYIDGSEEEDHMEDCSSLTDIEDDERCSDSSLSDHYGSFTTSWPQSYKQSIDLYTSVQSPSITVIETPSLTTLGSSFFNSTLIRRNSHLSHSSSMLQPLLHDSEDEQQRQPKWQLRKPSVEKHISELTDMAHGLPITSECSFRQAVLNGLNVLCGVGILSTPYAAKEGGWFGISFLLLFGVLSFYTGMLLRTCLNSKPGIRTYPDIGQAAFGTAGRVVISVILYMELYAACIEYIILEGDTLSNLFPNAHMDCYGLKLNSHHLFALMTTIVILPTVWLRDLRVLSYISAGGVVASFLVVLCLFWVGIIDNIGFNVKKTEALNLGTLPVAIGLYGFSYSGHAVFPNIYSSMAKPSQFPWVLLTSFGICTTLYIGVAVMGYIMFGDLTFSQYTLNLPKEYTASKIAVWTTVVNPFTKYALTMSPVALSLEELMPSNHPRLYAILIRTALVISSLVIGLMIPFFGLVMSFIGSLLTMMITLILPCACYLSIWKEKITYIEVTICCTVIFIGLVCSAVGSYSAIMRIIESFMR